MKIQKFLFPLLLLMIPLIAKGQFYTMGTDPARARWRQLEAGGYTLIYPREIDSLARRYAYLFEVATPHVMAPLNAKTPSIPVVLHPYNMNSNGMVVWAPKRMELYTTPPSSSYAQNWEKQLVLHETRHLGQMSKLSQNFFRGAQYIIGQQSQGLAAGGYVTKWMLEGDAVLSETEHSFSGRGREAAFLMPYRAYLTDSISFGWDIWRFGSYKYHTPNQYAFGYYLLSAMRYHHYRSDFLSDIFDMVTKRPYRPFINPLAFRQTTDQTRLQSWESATALAQSIWDQQQLQNGVLTPFRTLTDSVPPPKNSRNGQSKRPVAEYANYESITPVSADSVYALFHNLDRSTSLILIDSSGQKRHIGYVGSVNSNLIAGRGQLFWTELVPSLRWEQESFSLLRSFDTKSNTFTTLSKKSRYLFPSVSPSANYLAVVHLSLLGESSLRLLTATEGALISSHHAPNGGHIQSSAWASDSLLFASVLTDSGIGVYSLDIEKGDWSQIVPHQYRKIEHIKYYNGFLLFNSDLNGTDNIYALDPFSTPAQLFLLTNARYGAFGPETLNNTLYYANYTHAGLRPVSSHMDGLLWKRAHFDQPYESPIAQALSQQVQFRLDSVHVPENLDYRSKPYQKAQNLFRIHSWAPVYYNALDNIASLSMEELFHTVSPGVMLFSQNTLSTAVSQLGYAYRNGFHLGEAKFIYTGWYPVIEISATINERKAIEHRWEMGTNNQWAAKQERLGNPSVRVNANIYVPLNLRSNGWVRGFIPRLFLSYRNDKYHLPDNEKFNYYTSVQAGVQYYQYRVLAHRNIFPRWGFGASMQYATTPSTKLLFGSEFYLTAYGYLPGFVENQGIRLRATAQRQWMEGKRYYLSSLATFPRGYSARPSQEYLGFSMDYTIPVWLYDTSVGNLFYFKRLILTPFADWATNKNRNGTEKLYSIGTDIQVEFHALKIGSPITAGVRSILNADGSVALQMLFDIVIQ